MATGRYPGSRGYLTGSFGSGSSRIRSYELDKDEAICSENNISQSNFEPHIVHGTSSIAIVIESDTDIGLIFSGKKILCLGLRLL